MNTLFNDAHLDTIAKLKALVEKHGMKIRFGTDTSVSTDLSSVDFDEYMSSDASKLFDDNSDEIVERFDANVFEKLWFELFDPKPKEKMGRYHTMAYIESDISFVLCDDWESNIKYDSSEHESQDDDNKSIYSEMIEWINNNSYGSTMSVSDSRTVINGFGNDKEVIDHRVYREGMALHFFTELVCKYLNEPMIENTYLPRFGELKND